ncbi:MAG: hypothetical protein AVDCRST_MAG93-3265 [uncultured Chloroflexia bacterium]|uniref:Uncharacterized protein n=1 Tax=uncultured Chloroflexia bacterium TaxID=1672391 RepID=A0A6J4JM34_9CHLR|nr:MAG: hypothetical protein AVDCRST_MAG93-3265 [uncultured Chloroflexia bacterium]
MHPRVARGFQGLRRIFHTGASWHYIPNDLPLWKRSTCVRRVR